MKSLKFIPIGEKVHKEIEKMMNRHIEFVTKASAVPKSAMIGFADCIDHNGKVKHIK